MITGKCLDHSGSLKSNSPQLRLFLFGQQLSPHCLISSFGLSCQVTLDGGNAMTPSERKDLLKLLLHESAEARDDERYMFAQYAAIVSVAILILGAMATVFYTTCAAGYPGCPGTDKVIPISIWIYVGAPLLPIVLIGYGVFITVIQTLRSYYLR